MTYNVAEHNRRQNELDEMQGKLDLRWSNFTKNETYGFALLKVDVAGHSSLKRSVSKTLFSSIFLEFRNSVLNAITKHDGLIWVWMGDGGLIAFVGDHLAQRDLCWHAFLASKDIRESFSLSCSKLSGDDVKVDLRMAIGYAEFEFPGKNNLGEIHENMINVVSHLESQTFEGHTSVTRMVYASIGEMDEGDANKFVQIADKYFEDYEVFTSQQDGKLKPKFDILKVESLPKVADMCEGIKLASRDLDSDFYASLNFFVEKWAAKFTQHPNPGFELNNIIWTATFNGYIDDETSNKSNGIRTYPTTLISSIKLYPAITRYLCERICEYLQTSDPQSQLVLTLVSTLLPHHYLNFPHLIEGNRYFCYYEEFVGDYVNTIEKLIDQKNIVVERYTLVLKNDAKLKSPRYPIFYERDFNISGDLVIGELSTKSPGEVGPDEFLLSTGITRAKYDRSYQNQRIKLYNLRKKSNGQPSIKDDFVSRLHSKGHAFICKLSSDDFQEVNEHLDFVLFSIKQAHSEKPIIALTAHIDKPFRTVVLDINVGPDHDIVTRSQNMIDKHYKVAREPISKLESS